MPELSTPRTWASGQSRRSLPSTPAVAAERAEVPAEEVIRELKALGFSDIGKVVRWRPEVVYEDVESEDEPDNPARQDMASRVLVVDSETLVPNVRLAVASVSQTQSGL